MREEFEWVFEDPAAITITDDPRSEDEERYIVTGLSSVQRILVVCQTYRGEVVRLISARRATRQYEESK
jgi:uncharacterized protein